MNYTDQDCINVLQFIMDNTDRDILAFGIAELNLNHHDIQPVLAVLTLMELINQNNAITAKGIEYLNSF